jgi:hypothetical protein
MNIIATNNSQCRTTSFHYSYSKSFVELLYLLYRIQHIRQLIIQPTSTNVIIQAWNKIHQIIVYERKIGPQFPTLLVAHLCLHLAFQTIKNKDIILAILVETS